MLTRIGPDSVPPPFPDSPPTDSSAHTQCRSPNDRAPAMRMRCRCVSHTAVRWRSCRLCTALTSGLKRRLLLSVSDSDNVSQSDIGMSSAFSVFQSFRVWRTACGGEAYAGTQWAAKNEIPTWQVGQRARGSETQGCCEAAWPGPP